MAHYAIMRGEKRKTGDARGCVAHITRTQPTPNANPEKTAENYAVVGPGWDDAKGIHAAIEARTPDKYRKDAVRAIEFVVSASPSWFEQNPEREREYFEAAAQWFQSEFSSENVVSAVVHRDESSPHMHLLVVPRDDSSGKPKLNAKGIFGNKGVLQGRQNRFADHMAHFGVERGKPDPTRRHTKIAEWRAGHDQLDAREKGLSEREKTASAQMQEAQALSSSAREQIQEAYRLDDRNDDREMRLGEREGAVSAQLQEVKAREARASEREGQLVALERQLQERGERLSGGEQALAQRQAEIDHAGVVLQQRLDAQQAQQRDFEQQKAAWLDANRPTEVPPLVRQLQHMQTLHTPSERAEYLDEQDDDALYAAFDPLSGLTARGEAVLAEQAGTADKRQRWERDIEPPQGPGI